MGRWGDPENEVRAWPSGDRLESPPAARDPHSSPSSQLHRLNQAASGPTWGKDRANARGESPGHQSCTRRYLGGGCLPFHTGTQAGQAPLHYFMHPRLTSFYYASQVFCFYEPEARPSISKRILTHFIAILALWRWSGTEPTTSLRCACPHTQTVLRTQKYNHGGGSCSTPATNLQLCPKISAYSTTKDSYFQREKIKVLSSFNLILLLHRWS